MKTEQRIPDDNSRIWKPRNAPRMQTRMSGGVARGSADKPLTPMPVIEFLSLSQAFVLNQIAGLINRRHGGDIEALHRALNI